MRYHLPVLFLGLFLSGCVSIQDITGKAKYQTYLGDYQPGAVYRLMKSAQITPFQPGGPLPVTSLTPHYGLYVGTQFQVDVVPAGTQMRFKKVLYHKIYQDGVTYPVAVLLDGPHAGTEVDISGISRRVFDARLENFRPPYLRDPDWLELVTPALTTQPQH